jgi:hypothetical protein
MPHAGELLGLERPRRSAGLTPSLPCATARASSRRPGRRTIEPGNRPQPQKQRRATSSATANNRARRVAGWLPRVAILTSSNRRQGFVNDPTPRQPPATTTATTGNRRVQPLNRSGLRRHQQVNRPAPHQSRQDIRHPRRSRRMADRPRRVPPHLPAAQNRNRPPHSAATRCHHGSTSC